MAASSQAVSAPRAQMQAKAARASGGHPAQQPGLGVLLALGHGGHGQPVVGEHVLDRLVLVLAQSAAGPRSGRPLPAGQEQLGHDLVGAAEIEQLDAGEVEQRGEAVGARHGLLDTVPDGGAGGAGDEVPVGRGDRLAQQVADVDGLDHRASASWAGMMICTWAPGKNGRCSPSGMSSSHGGTIASRAVPLRIEILPFH